MPKTAGIPAIRRKLLAGVFNRSALAKSRGIFPAVEEIVAFLKRKWGRELDYRLIKEMWAFEDHRIAVRFAYEWHDDSGNSFRPTATKIGNLIKKGLMRVRHASINDLPIAEAERKYRSPLRRSPTITPA